MTRRKMTAIQTVAVGVRLSEVCSKKGGYAVYAEGWDDAKVCADFPGVSPNSVKYLRLKMFGVLLPTADPKGVQVAELQERQRGTDLDMQQVFDRLKRLEEWVLKLDPAYGEE